MANEKLKKQKNYPFYIQIKEIYEQRIKSGEFSQW